MGSLLDRLQAEKNVQLNLFGDEDTGDGRVCKTLIYSLFLFVVLTFQTIF